MSASKPTKINDLSESSAVVDADQFVIYSSTNGGTRKVAASVLKEYAQEGAGAASSATVKQYASPSATGFTITITEDEGRNVWLQLTPDDNYASGTIKLPAIADCVDDQEILINISKDITALTIDGNGAADVRYPPEFLEAGDHMRLRLDASTATWWCTQ